MALVSSTSGATSPMVPNALLFMSPRHRCSPNTEPGGDAAASRVMPLARRPATSGRAGLGTLASRTSSTGSSIWNTVAGPPMARTPLISASVASVNGRR